MKKASSLDVHEEHLNTHTRKIIILVQQSCWNSWLLVLTLYNLPYLPYYGKWWSSIFYFIFFLEDVRACFTSMLKYNWYAITDLYWWPYSWLLKLCTILSGSPLSFTRATSHLSFGSRIRNLLMPKVIIFIYPFVWICRLQLIVNCFLIVKVNGKIYEEN